MKFTFYVVETATYVAEHFYDEEIVDSDEIWEKLHENIADFMFAIYDEVERQLEEKGIKVEYL